MLLLGGAPVDAGGVQQTGHLVHLVSGALQLLGLLFNIQLIKLVSVTQSAVGSGGGRGADKLHACSVISGIKTEM